MTYKTGVLICCDQKWSVVNKELLHFHYTSRCKPSKDINGKAVCSAVRESPGLMARFEVRFCWGTSHSAFRSLALEAPQQPPEQEACQKTLDTEADDEHYIEETICARSESDPPIVEEEASHFLSEVSSPRVVVDQYISQNSGAPVSPQKNQ